MSDVSDLMLKRFAVLYGEPKTILLFGDALETIQGLALAVGAAATPVAVGTQPALAT